MGKIFNSRDLYLNINKDEVVIIKGDYNDFEFVLHMRSEEFDVWIPQDMGYISRKYPEAYERLLTKVTDYLIRVGSCGPLTKGFGN